MDTSDPWVRVAGTALAMIRGRRTPENILISGWSLLLEAGRRAGLDFPADLGELERLHLPALVIDARAFALQSQSLSDDAARHGGRRA